MHPAHGWLLCMPQPVIDEILATERGYLKNLETLIQVYVQPLREDRVRSLRRGYPCHRRVASRCAGRGSNGASSTPKC